MIFKEFCNQESVDVPINEWLKKNPDIKMIDIKYSANGFGSHALIVYEEAERENERCLGKK